MKRPGFLLSLFALLSFTASADEAKPAAAPAADAKPVKVLIQTSKGDIELELDAAKAPKTVKNFIAYAKKGHYDGTIFHRVIPGFMIQGGGMSADMTEKQTDGTLENEAKNGLKNARGTIAMARKGDPHSATAQFFINLADNTPLDFPSRDGWGYCVFGKVTKGMEVVDEIAKAPTADSGRHQNVPVEPITIKKAKVVE
jgi:cyclophilin family peptidyl-prolyl cis-trans isomerase